MRRVAFTVAAAWLAAVQGGVAVAEPADSRLKDIWYDPEAVVTVPVKRGVVTLILLDPSESITEVASGLGADCAKPDSSWCVAAQAGGRSLFVKPKSSAGPPNNLAVVTDKRTHSFRFEVLADSDRRAPVYRLTIKAAMAKGSPAVVKRADSPSLIASAALLAPPAVSSNELIIDRLTAAPEPVNFDYSIAEGKASEEIVPTLVFDDGRFTYLRFPNNREVPAVFHVLGDGSETLTNARMEGDLLVVDRVSRRLVLRAGSAVVGVWNEAFDPDGVPPADGMTVPGVSRTLRTHANAARKGADR